MDRDETEAPSNEGTDAAKHDKNLEFRVTDQIGFILRLAHQRANANLAEKLTHLELTPAQAVVLARLAERGSVSQNLLGRLVAMEPANIRDVVLRLKRRRFISQDRDQADRRLVLLRLTPAGDTMARKLIPISMKNVQEILSPLSPRERDTLRALLKRISGVE